MENEKRKKEGYYLVIEFGRNRSNKNSNVLEFDSDISVSDVISSESDSDSYNESSQYCTRVRLLKYRTINKKNSYFNSL